MQHDSRRGSRDKDAERTLAVSARLTGSTVGSKLRDEISRVNFGQSNCDPGSLRRSGSTIACEKTYLRFGYFAQQYLTICAVISICQSEKLSVGIWRFTTSIPKDQWFMRVLPPRRSCVQEFLTCQAARDSETTATIEDPCPCSSSSGTIQCAEASLPGVSQVSNAPAVLEPAVAWMTTASIPLIGWKLRLVARCSFSHGAFV